MSISASPVHSIHEYANGIYVTDEMGHNTGDSWYYLYRIY